MEELESLIRTGRELWRGLGLGRFEKNCIIALAVGIFFYVIVYAAERISHTRTDNYCSRSFLHDAVYWFYYRSQLNWFLFMAAIFTTLDNHLSFLDLHLLTPYPIVVQVLIFLVVADFFVYWSHRAMHHFKFLWAFHTTHHAPERITFASSARFHPVEVICQYCWYYVLIRISGGNALTWLPILIIMELSLEAQHTQIPWKLGPFYRVFVTPTFHSYHHSADPEHYNKNFSSSMFSFWDYLFGTAVKDTRKPPVRLGLDDVRMTSLWSTLAMPFHLVLEFYGLTKRTDSRNGQPRLSE